MFAVPLWGLAQACAPAPGSADAWAPPDNAWPKSAPPEGLRGEGFEPGQVLPEVRLLDQHGDEVSLWQFHDRVVLVTLGAVWCAPCRHLAVDAAALVETYGEQGLIHVTVLEEDASGLDPVVEDAAAWAAEFGDDAPVLVDPEHLFGPVLAGSFPVSVVVSRELIVSAVVTDATVDLSPYLEEVL